jgi:malonyl-CoA decarboxylase
MPMVNSLSNLLDSLVKRATRERLLGRFHVPSGAREGGAGSPDSALRLADELLHESSQSASVGLALKLLGTYRELDADGKLEFLLGLSEGFCADPEAVRDALAAYDRKPSSHLMGLVGKVAEPPRQELLRRLNQAPRATHALVNMRADLLRLLPQNPRLRALEEDFVHLLHSWFNRGFLVMQRIDWSSSAELLERIIRYEAVHSIATWDELRDRLLPRDRRCYAFFHPALGDEPLIFVEVALTDAVPSSIQHVLAPGRPASDPDKARVAVFYSISNCQPGLAGISFGQFLIKQVVDDLRSEFRQLETFVTLSPVPGFTAWLARAAAHGDAAAAAALAAGEPDAAWPTNDPRRQERIALAARYFLVERDERGRVLDPVARFHVGNGASIDRLCWLGDTSRRGMEQAGGFMVNYRYDLATVEANHRAYARHREVAASAVVRELLEPRAARSRRVIA